MADFPLNFDFGLSTHTVCQLFANFQKPEVYEYLCKKSESPLQVPYHFLALASEGQVSLHCDTVSRPSREEVEIAYRAILQRGVESSEMFDVQIENSKNTLSLIVSLLTSVEANTSMPVLWSRAFPVADRLWHVHIPKTAGSSFVSMAMNQGWSFINTNVRQSAIGNPRNLGVGVKIGEQHPEKQLITGHWRLPQFLHCIGPFDRLITFARDPLERLVSEFNYFVDVCNHSPNVHKDNPKTYLNLGFDPECFVRTYENGFFQKNLQCQFLATDSTCVSALANLDRLDAVILPSTALNRITKQYFGISKSPRVNVSNKHLRCEDLDASLKEELLLANQQDLMLWQITSLRYEEYYKSESNERSSVLTMPAVDATPRRMAA